MKFPSYTEFSKEQDKIYNLPLTNNYLVTGPPGTGKTVIALFRAWMYQQQKETPILLSRSRLLSAYMQEAAISLKIGGRIKTYHKWVTSVYQSYFSEDPPEIDEYVYDWDAMIPRLVSAMMEDQPYLLIDEGQDLPKKFYAAVALIARNFTVFADENQRITTTQSTFEEIRKQAMIESKHVFRLTRNYRNTRQIAEVAARFYAGLSSGKPDLPEKEGPLPEVQHTNDLDDAIARICQFEGSFPHLQIGVFTKTTDFQEILIETLLGKTANPVEFYRSGMPVPTFGNPGIKLITFASAKGLEFDAVFLPELQAIHMDIRELDNKMLFYVLLSRAREYLYMQYSGPVRPALFDLIPNDLVKYS